MKYSMFKIQNSRLVFCILLFIGCGAFSVAAQSTNQDYPTPVTSSEISGRIAARDVGDARLTSYFFAFDGTQGDIFINVEASNLNGDIDVFTVGNLRPLTKISLYAGDNATETGRVIYLRKSEKLILRVQGRTPNDNPATFRIKFAGSFVALQNGEVEQPKLPEIKTNENSEIKVNSVGTIIEVRPKPTPTPKTTTIAQKTEEKPDETVKTQPEENAEANKTQVENNSTDSETTEKPAPENTVAENVKPAEKVKPAPRSPRRNRRPPAESTPPVAKPEKKVVTKTPRKPTAVKNTAEKTEKPNEPPTNPLASVKLIVILKDGSKIERPMSEVSRVNVDNKGMLTIVAKDGTITRHSILDVAKMTIE